MAIVANTFLTFSAVGNREDLIEQIYNISPTDRPFTTNIAKTTARATKHEWQTDSLAAAAQNAQLEGDDVAFGSVTATTRLDNICQFSYKATIVSGTQDAVNKAGRTKEIIYQLMKRGKELNRDIEFVLTNNTAKNAGNSTTARTMRSLCSWYTTNVQRGSGGASGSASTAATDGTQRPLTEALLKKGIQDAWTQGGDPDLIMVGPFNKQVISTFSGNNSRVLDTTNKKLTTAIDIYVSDFGEHRVVANRFSRDRDCHILTTDLWAMAWLRPLQTSDLAKTGDHTKGFITAEYTLEARNEAGSAIVADLATS